MSKSLDPSVYQVERWYGYPKVLTLHGVLAMALVWVQILCTSSCRLGQLLLQLLEQLVPGTLLCLHSQIMSLSPVSSAKLGRTPIRASFCIAFGLVENSPWQDVHPDDPEPGAAQRGRHWGRSQTAVQRGTPLSAQVSQWIRFYSLTVSCETFEYVIVNLSFNYFWKNSRYIWSKHSFFLVFCRYKR